MLQRTTVVMTGFVLLLLSIGNPATGQETNGADRRKQEDATERTIAKLNKQMDELAASFRKAGTDTRDELNRLFDEFKKKQAAARKQLQEMRDATNEQWDALKAKMNKNIDELQRLHDRAKTQPGKEDKSQERAR